MVAESSEVVAGICEQAAKPKSAEPHTWTHIYNNLIWDQFLIMIMMNVGLVGSLIMYGFGLHSVPLKWMTIAWIFIVGIGTLVGTTAGAHRLWSHRSYKAKVPLRILLVLMYSVMGMYSIYNWARDHRVHHKYTETDADPYNAKRGFVFSHLGWLCIKRHPECIRRGREVDMSDVKADKICMFQKNYGTWLNIIFCLTLPPLTAVVLWDETVLNAVLTQCFIRYMLAAHGIWSINSFAHLWGGRPYNKHINPAENLFVNICTIGEGSHNYHHTFPWDYKAAEIPYINFNGTTVFIDLMAKIGWAYDLKEPSPKLIEKVIRRIGYQSNRKTLFELATYLEEHPRYYTL